MIEPAFGDNVRIRTAPETEARGIAGSSGSVTGFTTPSVTSVEVIGDLSDDHALAVTLDESGETYWLTPELVEFVDHAPGTEIWVDGAPFKSVRTETGEWIDLPGHSGGAGDDHGVFRVIAPAFGAASVFQAVLGAYRASVLRVSFLPAGLFALALAVAGLLCWLRRRNAAVHMLVRSAGVVLIMIGVLVMVAAFNASFPGLVSRVSVPLLFVSTGMILLLPKPRWRMLVLALTLFVAGFAGVQLALTYDAQWQTENRARGINAIWR